MQNVKNHKVLAFFDILAIGLIIFGSSTDILVPGSGTSISGGIAAWGGLLLVVMVFVDGIVLARRHKNANQLSNKNIASNAQQQRAFKANGISIILGAFLGLVGTYIFLAPQGGDAGLLFIHLAAIFVPAGAIILFIISKLLFGKR